MRDQYKILSEKYQMVKEQTEPVMKVDEKGNKRWYLNGVLHRTDGAAIEYANGNKEWYLNGKLHREGGPAIEYAYGYKAWYLNDKHHRTDGPAIEFANGTKYWFLNGEEYTEADWKNQLEIRKGLTSLAKFRVKGT